MKNIIFHHPLPLNPKATSASGIRPLKMLSAFKEFGYDIDLVVGYSSERKNHIKRIKENIENGKVYDFVYSESSTMPTILTDKHHLPLNPTLDYKFFAFCKKKSIPIGLFYRDIYWLFDSYGQGLNPIKSLIAKLCYRFDLWVYKKTVDMLYLPSEQMGEYIPYIDSSCFKALPPGHISPTVKNFKIPNFKDKPLKLFYVGGVSEHYQMHKLFSAVSKLSNVTLTVCTRESEWLAVKSKYPPLTSNIKVVHLSGQQMEEQLISCDVALLFVKPQEYREFASPVKLYEYLGYKKPILSSEGTLSANFVRENGIGWVLPYEEKELIELCETLLATPELFLPIQDNLLKVSLEHSWSVRAKQVIKELTQ